jgi:hypothetical protein
MHTTHTQRLLATTLAVALITSLAPVSVRVASAQPATSTTAP